MILWWLIENWLETRDNFLLIPRIIFLLILLRCRCSVVPYNWRIWMISSHRHRFKSIESIHSTWQKRSVFWWIFYLLCFWQECIKPVEIKATKSKTGSKITIADDGYYDTTDVSIAFVAHNKNPIRITTMNNHRSIFTGRSAAEVTKSRDHIGRLSGMFRMHNISRRCSHHSTKPRRSAESAQREPGKQIGRWRCGGENNCLHGVTTINRVISTQI